MGIVLSVHRFIRLVANSLAGILYDRLGRRQPFLLGMALAFVSTLGYLLAWGFWPLLAARLIWGMAFALVSVGAFSILLDVTTPADRGGTVGFYHSLVEVGRLVALLLSGVLADLVGYRVTLAIFPPLTALGWLVAFLALGETRPGHPSLLRTFRSTAASRSRESETAADARVGSEVYPLRAIYCRLDRRLLAPSYVSFAMFFAGNGVLMATLGAHLKEELSGPGSNQALLIPLASLTGVLLGLRKVGGIVSAPLAGYLSDRVTDRRHVVGTGILTSLAGFVVLAAAQGMAAIVIGVALTALGEGILLPSVAAWAGDFTPATLRGAITGGLATANDLGGATGPLVGYAFGTRLGFRGAYALCALLLLSALVALAAGGPRLRRNKLLEWSH